MEIRIRIPTRFSAIKYLIRNPKSFIIGKYGYKEWVEQHQLYLNETSKNIRLEEKLRKKNEQLKERGLELSRLKKMSTD